MTAAAPHVLVQPLGPGGRIDWWQLSPVREERFDIAAEPMAGGMDARFFLSRHRNYIPHEYPCRRAFAALHRDRRPEPATGFVQAEGDRGWWVPFDSDRVDLSGFWHRPTRVEAWARSAIRLDAAGEVRLSLTTCGAASLRIDGGEVLWLAPYLRNLETTREVSIGLEAGAHRVEVWFGDLCERDTRWWFRLCVLDGPPARIELPVPVPAERAEALVAQLGGMRFDRPAYPDGTVTVLFDRPPASRLDAEIVVEGHFMSADRAAFRASLPPGSRTLPVAEVARLPADFRYFTIRLIDGALALSRRLGVEVVDAAAQGPAPATLADRVDEALAHVCADSEADPAGAVARLACGRAGPETDAMLAAAVGPIADCFDCADFLLVPMLWARMRHGEAIDAALRREIDGAILGFRYWLDEPGNDVMWYFSENHALLFHTSCYLAGTLFPDAVFARSGRIGREQRAVGRERLLRWLDHFEAHEMAEWNSAPYFPIDLKGLAALYVLAPDADIADRAGRSIRRLLEIVALACHQGLHVASQGRSYEHTLRAARTLELSAIARLVWGRGWYGRQVQCLPLLALAIRDHGLAVPAELAELAIWRDDRELEWTFVQGEGGFAPLYHWKTRHAAMGSLAAYRSFEWGYQETVLHARLGTHPDAQLWINHPGEWIVSGFARPSFWGGCGTLPRVHQYRGLAWLRFDCHPETPGFTHAHVAFDAYDEVIVEPHRVLLRSGEGLALIWCSAALEHVAHGSTAGVEIRADGRRADWLVRLSDLAREGSLAAFGDRMAGLSPRPVSGGTGEDGAGREARVVIDDPDYGPVACDGSGRTEAEGRTLDPAGWTRAGRARLSDGTDRPLPSHSGPAPAPDRQAFADQRTAGGDAR